VTSGHGKRSTRANFIAKNYERAKRASRASHPLAAGEVEPDGAGRLFGQKFISRRHLTQYVAKRRRKRSSGFHPVSLDISKTLLTLASNTAVLGNLTPDTVNDRYWCISALATYAIRDLTVGEGPIQVGLIHGGLTLQELEEWIEQASMFSRGTIGAREIQSRGRYIRLVGTFSGEKSHEVLNNGLPIKTKLNYPIETNGLLTMFAYNNSGALLTTGAEVDISGRMFGRYMH